MIEWCKDVVEMMASVLIFVNLVVRHVENFQFAQIADVLQLVDVVVRDPQLFQTVGETFQS